MDFVNYAAWMIIQSGRQRNKKVGATNGIKTQSRRSESWSGVSDDQKNKRNENDEFCFLAISCFYVGGVKAGLLLSPQISS